MKAVIWTKYGPPDVLQLRDVEKPAPADNELLIRNYAMTVTVGDCALRGFKDLSVFWLPMRLYVGLLRPTRITILGQELAGEIEAVGKNVTLFKEGDQVFAATGFSLSAYAEYVCLPEDEMVALKPANMSYEEAATVPLGGIEASHYLRRANLQGGEKVLINGAGGSIGTFAVQLARHFGAEVTAVDSAEKLDMLLSLGAAHVIDYTREAFTENGETYDVIFDVIGATSASRCARSLKPGGRFLSANPGPVEQLRGLWGLVARRDDVVSEYTGGRRENLIFLRELIETGALKSVIDRTYPLAQTAEAHRYAETGQKKGHIVITLQ